MLATTDGEFVEVTEPVTTLLHVSAGIEPGGA